MVVHVLSDPKAHASALTHHPDPNSLPSIGLPNPASHPFPRGAYFLLFACAILVSHFEFAQAPRLQCARMCGMVVVLATCLLFAWTQHLSASNMCWSCRSMIAMSMPLGCSTGCIGPRSASTSSTVPPFMPFIGSTARAIRFMSASCASATRIVEWKAKRSVTVPRR